MDEGTKYPSIKIILVILVTIVSNRFWSFHGISETIFDVLELLVALALVGIVLTQYHTFRYGNAQFKANVALFLILPMISSVAAALFHKQSFFHSFLALRTNFFWLLYFCLHIFDVSPKFIIRWMVIVGVVWALLTIGQQFTYPFLLFYTRDGEDGQQLLRAGMYRFMINPHQFGLFLVLYHYNKFLIRGNLSSIAYVLVGLVGFYCFATRQFAIGVLICMIAASIMQPGMTKIYATLVLATVLFFLSLSKGSLLSPYIEMTSEQIGMGDDVRMYAAKFFLYDYWPNWFATVIGNGLEHMNSKYGEEMAYLNEMLGYYKSDVGIIGALNSFGLIYVLNIVWVNIKGLRVKYYTKENEYLRLIFLYSFLLLIISEYYSYASAIPFFCFSLYLVDKSYLQAKRDAKKEQAVEEGEIY